MAPTKAIQDISLEVSTLKSEVLEQLKESSCIKFGEFKLKSGITSQVYVNLREATMYPSLFNNLIKLVEINIPQESKHPEGMTGDWSFTHSVAIVGVPYGVVPLASAAAYQCKMPYYPLRKEVKDYGCKPDSEAYSDYKYVIVEDVMSSGSSIIETLEKLKDKKVTDVIVIVDRELGGGEKLQAEYPNINVKSIFSMSEIMSEMKAH